MKLNKKVAYALIGAGSLTLYGIFNTYTLFFYTDVVKLNARWVGVGWFLFSFWNAINDVASGWISDKSLGLIKKRGTLIRLLALPTAICFAMLWNPIYASVWYFLLAISIFDFFYSLLTVNYGAMFPQLFRVGKERIRASAINRAVGYGIGGGLTALAPLIYGEIGWGAMGVYLGVLAVGFYFLGAKQLNEKQVTPEETKFVVMGQFREAFKNTSFRYVMGAGICLRFVLAVFVSLIPFYTKYVLRLSGYNSSVLLLAFIGASLIGLIYWERIFKIRGIRNTMLLSLGVAIVLLIPFMMAMSVEMTVLLLILIGGASGGGMLMGPDLLFAEVLDDDYKNTKRRREGVYTGLLGFTFRFPPALVGIILGELLTWAKYDAGLGVFDQTVEVSKAIRIFFAIGPMVAMFLGIVFLWKYPLKNGEERKLLTEATEQTF